MFFYFAENTENEEPNPKTANPTRQPYANNEMMTIRPKMDQADLNPGVNESTLEDLGAITANVTTPQQPKYASRAESSPTQPMIQTAAKSIEILNQETAENARITMEAKNNHSSMPRTPTTVQPLGDYSTVFPGLLFPSRRPPAREPAKGLVTTAATKLEGSEQGRQQQQQQIQENVNNQGVTAMPTKVPQRTTRQGVYSTGYWAGSTRPWTGSTGLNSVKNQTTARPTTTRSAKYDNNNGSLESNETTEEAESKDSFAVAYPQQNAGLPHQVFNPEEERKQDEEAEAERIRLMYTTTPAPVTYNKDSDEDVTSPDNENQDDDWHGLRYGPLALPPAFQETSGK